MYDISNQCLRIAPRVVFALRVMPGIPDCICPRRGAFCEPFAAEEGRPVQLRRRLLPARRPGDRRRPGRHEVQDRRHQRPAQEHGRPGSRRRAGLHGQLWLEGPDQQDAEKLRHRPDHQPHAGPTCWSRSAASGSRSRPPTRSPASSWAWKPATRRSADDQVQKVEFLNLLTDEGLRSVSPGAVSAIKLLNEKLDSELRKALALLASSHDMDKKTVTINFRRRGQARRPRGLHPGDARLEDQLPAGAGTTRRPPFCKAGRSSRTRPKRTGTA